MECLRSVGNKMPVFLTLRPSSCLGRRRSEPLAPAHRWERQGSERIATQQVKWGQTHIECKEMRTFWTLQNGFHGSQDSHVNVHIRGMPSGSDQAPDTTDSSPHLQEAISVRPPPC